MARLQEEILRPDLVLLAANEVTFALLFLGGRALFTQQVYDGLIDAVAHVEALACAGDVADDDVDAGSGGSHID